MGEILKTKDSGNNERLRDEILWDMARKAVL